MIEYLRANHQLFDCNREDHRLKMKTLNDVGSWFDLPVKFRNCIENWHSKTPKEKFDTLYNIPKIMFSLVGVHVFGDSHLNLYSYFGNVMVAYYLSMTAHTLFYWKQKDQLVFGTRCFCGMGIMISSVPLYWKAIGRDRFIFNRLLNFAGNFMYENKKGTSKFSQVCEEGAFKMLQSYAILTCIICTSMTSVSLGPMLIFLRHGVWITPLGTQFPYADQYDSALYLDVTIQMVIAMLGVLVTVSIEMAQVIINNAVDMSADVLELNIKQLAEQMSNDKQFRPHAKFRNIILQIQDFNRFISDFHDIFYWRTFLGPGALAFATAHSAFTQYILDFPAGYGTAVASYIQMLILCYMGHNVQCANELIYDSLTNIPWYCMHILEQKMLCSLLYQTQNGLQLSIGPFSILNYEMATKLSSLDSN